ncbi:hypothetical protein [Nonomuraea recticatena]|uniref:hypothetical protein n=1 Tax=Nonomuraea recticatena TaxID=46178 RepID=UPI0031F866E0
MVAEEPGQGQTILEHHHGHDLGRVDVQLDHVGGQHHRLPFGDETLDVGLALVVGVGHPLNRVLKNWETINTEPGSDLRTPGIIAAQPYS